MQSSIRLDTRGSRNVLGTWTFSSSLTNFQAGVTCGCRHVHSSHRASHHDAWWVQAKTTHPEASRRTSCGGETLKYPDVCTCKSMRAAGAVSTFDESPSLLLGPTTLLKLVPPPRLPPHGHLRGLSVCQHATRRCIVPHPSASHLASSGAACLIMSACMSPRLCRAPQQQGHVYVRARSRAGPGGGHIARAATYRAPRFWQPDRQPPS